MSETAKIAEIITDVNPGVTVEPERFADSLLEIGLDSLDHASVLLQVEESFDVKIPDEMADSLLSINAIANFVAEQSHP